MRSASEIEIGGRRIKLTNLHKVLYPSAGFTKAQVIDYYVRIAPVLLPHLHDRPLTLKRFPDGVDGGSFYEKNCSKFRPSWVRTAAVYSRSNRRDIHFCLAEDVPTLVWIANLAGIELHTSLSHVSDVGQPTAMVYDLDPGAPADLVQCCHVALLLRRILERVELQGFPKVSGSKGLQLYVPLNTPVTYDETRGFALALAQFLERKHPDLVVSDMKKSLRSGKVLIDWSQNSDFKTTVSVYSLRARDAPTVSMPVTWQEVERCARKRDPSALSFPAPAALARVDELGDLFAPVLTLKQRLVGLDL